MKVKEKEVLETVIAYIRNGKGIYEGIRALAEKKECAVNTVERHWIQLRKKHQDEIEFAKTQSEYLKHERVGIYTPLEDDEEFEWCWDERDVEQFDKWCEEGKTLNEISELFDRDVFEVLVLLIDRVRKDAVNPTPRKLKSLPLYKQRMMQSV